MPTDMVQSFRIDPADLPNETVLFGNTAAMREVHVQIERILHNDLPVLIQGESGTGKEMVARFLHARSDRRDLPFVKVICCGKGLFLDEANGPERWLVDAAAGGTLFFDEIGDLGWDLQVKLLDLLEERQPSAGEAGGRARVICSTNRNLETAVERRAFRRDLFYRIDVISLHLAPLRERTEDIPQLCDHFIEKLTRRFDKTAPELSVRALQLLKKWSWPGNLRELENRIARLIVLGDDGALEAELNRRIEPRRPHGMAAALHKGKKEVSRASALPARASLLRALKANRWNRRRAAEDLHMTYRSFLARMREAGVPRRRRSNPGAPPEPRQGCD